MVTTTQKSAAKENGQHAKAVWQGMSSRQRARSQPDSHRRAEPGTKGGGNYYRIVIRPKEQFTTFRTQDIGEPGGLQRLAGKRSTGSWATQTWLVNKDSAHVEGKKLIADNKDVQDLIRQLGSQPTLEKGDIFTAKNRPHIAEKDNPMPAKERASGPSS